MEYRSSSQCNKEYEKVLIGLVEKNPWIYVKEYRNNFTELERDTMWNDICSELRKMGIIMPGKYL